VRIIAEVNSPGHMEPWIAPYPDLQLVNKDGIKQSAQLDITKPEALGVITTLADEYFEHFDTDYWHMGADEYLLGSGTLSDYPQFKEAALAKWGPDAKEIDVFIDFINQVNAHVKSKGKQLRIWNDGLKDYNIVQLDKDIIVEHWTKSGQGVQKILNYGNDMVNADGRLYFTRNGAWGNPKARWDEGWTPMNFYGNVVNSAGKVLGAKLTLWPDNGPGMTENQLFSASRETLRLVAQATWGSPRPVDTYAQFQALGILLGTGPSTVAIDWAPVPAGEYVIFAGELNLTAGSPVTAGEANTTWTISTTNDGYYKIASGEECLVMHGNTDLT